MLVYILKTIIKSLNLKLMVMWEYSNIKTFLEKVELRIGQKELSLLKELKILYRGHMQDVNDEEIIQSLYEKELQNTNENLDLKKE